MGQAKIIRASNNQLYEIDDICEDEKIVKAFPFGGGFVCKITFDEITDWNAKIADDYEYCAVFLCEEPKVCEGFINKEVRWNGWLEPLVTIEQLKLVRKFMNTQTDGWYKMIVHRDKSVSLVENNDGDICKIADRQRPRNHTIDGKEYLLYDIGWGFCWDK